MILNFTINRADTKVGESVIVTGNLPQLGSWSAKNAVPLDTNRESYPTWCTNQDIQIDKASDLDALTAIEYKYIVTNKDGTAFWEKSKENRIILLKDLPNILPGRA